MNVSSTRSFHYFLVCCSNSSITNIVPKTSHTHTHTYFVYRLRRPRKNLVPYKKQSNLHGATWSTNHSAFILNTVTNSNYNELQVIIDVSLISKPSTYKKNQRAIRREAEFSSITISSTIGTAKAEQLRSSRVNCDWKMSLLIKL